MSFIIKNLQCIKKYFFEPISPPEWFTPPPRKHVLYSQVIGGLMFFWFLYRAKHDGPVLLVSKSFVNSFD